MAAALDIYRRLSPLLAIALIPLALLLVIQKGETRHWHKQSDQFEALYHGEQTAHAVTVANYRAAADQARAAAKATADKAAAEQRLIKERSSHDFEARIAAARAAADRLRRELGQAATHSGGGGATPVPGVSAPAGGAPQAPGQDGLSIADRLTATEQAIQLDELITAIERLAATDPNREPAK